MWLIVGLGNYGNEYLTTKHNIGFLIVDQLANDYNLTWSNSTKFKSAITTHTLNNEKLIFSKPSTFMNLSGEAINAIASYYRISSSNILVIHDDLDLPVDVVKFKQGGGTGGHNGLKSLDSYINSNYFRIRVGIGRPIESYEISNYVLSKLGNEELNIVHKIGQKISQYLYQFIDNQYSEFKNQITKK